MTLSRNPKTAQHRRRRRRAVREIKTLAQAMIQDMPKAADPNKVRIEAASIIAKRWVAAGKTRDFRSFWNLTHN